MSIIYDALKKTEAALRRMPKPVSATQGNPPSADPKPISKVRMVFIYLSIVLVGFAISSLLFKVITPSMKRPLDKPLQQVVNPASKQPVEVEAVKQDEPGESEVINEEVTPISPRMKRKIQDEFVLNGIFFSADQGYALINNLVVKVGDELNEAVVRKINVNSVVLEIAGTLFEITNPR
ncbi:MAG: hypothetical protein KJ923_04890 [Candidatus Omnitrophica bacterium]|nr:hypothetical protein [Candidatus Omnitrophota bacterium]